MIQRICVFCGSQPGVNGAYLAAAREFGRLLAEQQIELVFGAGMTGIMGAVADATLHAGGSVIGIIPDSMNIPKVVHEGVSELIVTPDMPSRKTKMIAMSDAFVALPGGFGTMDELFEVLTFSQLGYQPKPIGILNVANYYAPLIAFIDHAVKEGFVNARFRTIFTSHDESAALLTALQHFEHPQK